MRGMWTSIRGLPECCLISESNSFCDKVLIQMKREAGYRYIVKKNSQASRKSTKQGQIGRQTNTQRKIIQDTDRHTAQESNR